MLVGRGSERKAVDALLRDAAGGRNGTLVIRGEPGIGKTALLGYAAERAEEFTVLRAVGVESESELPYSALHELLGPLVSGLDELPERQAAALRTAFALGPPGEPDRFGASAAALGLLSDASTRRPVLVCVDDAQWIDDASADALRFVCRRLGGQRVAVLIAARVGEPRTFEAPELPELHLSGLHREAAQALLDRVAPDLDGITREQVLGASLGNPLALVEMPAAFGSGAAPQEPARVGTRVARAFLSRVRALPETTQKSLLVAAASDRTDVATIGAALRLLGLEAASLDDAERARLVTLGDGNALFAHPLVRSAVYEAADPAERRAAHRALAEALRATDDVERHPWHLAAASTEPDEGVASALDAAAESAASRGSGAAASYAYERAARLSPDRERRARRLLLAAGAAWAIHLERVEQLCREALEVTRDAALRGDIHAELETALYWRGDLPAAHAIKLQTADELETVAPVQSAQMRARATASLKHFLHGTEAVDLASAALEQVQEVGGYDARVLLMYAQAIVRVGKSAEALEIAEQLAAPVDNEADTTLGMNLADVYELLDDFDSATRHLRAWMEPTRRAGDVCGVSHALEHRARLELLRGNGRAAHAMALESVELASLVPDEFLQTAESATWLAVVTASLGRREAAREHATRAIDFARQCSSRFLELQVRAAGGALALALGDTTEAIDELEHVRDVVRGGGYRHPAFVQFSPELVEAYVHAGRLDEAAREAEELGAEAELVGTPWALAVAARSRGLLTDDFNEAFEEALAQHQKSPRLFELARTQLAYGERLRRGGDRTRARELLRAALNTFEASGTEAWSRRAQTELSASGEKIRATETADEELTPQELQVARVVADGATNKEAAAHLFLSTKTIEFHLRNAYRKLGVRSRVELTRRLVPAERA